MCAAFLVIGMAFTVVIAPTPPLPFDTPAPTRLRYVQVNDGVCTTSWMLKCPQTVVDRAAAEGLARWSRSEEQDGLDSIVYAQADEELTIVGWNFGSTAQPETHVLYDRPATGMDFVDSIVYRVRGWLE